MLLWAAGLGALVLTTARMHLSVNHEALSSSQVATVIRVNTFRRNDLLKRFIDHYSMCKCVAEITVVWSDLDSKPPNWLQKRRKVTVEIHDVDSLNNRFKPLSRPSRPAVFSVDDDIIVSCDTLTTLLEAWAVAPAQIVGPAPRLVTRDNRYLRWWYVWWNGRYSLVLTKVAVFHRDYLYAYSANGDVMTAVREHVDKHRNCEDIAMSFLIANATNAPPLWVKARYVDYGQSFYAHAGISASADHLDVRRDCIRHFTTLFNTFPLVTSRHKLVSADSAWFW